MWKTKWVDLLSFYEKARQTPKQLSYVHCWESLRYIRPEYGYSACWSSSFSYRPYMVVVRVQCENGGRRIMIRKDFRTKATGLLIRTLIGPSRSEYATISHSSQVWMPFKCQMLDALSKPLHITLLYSTHSIYKCIQKTILGPVMAPA
jgi:hypothetical protein